MHAPAHLAPPSAVERLGKLAFWVLGGCLAFLTLSGIWLALKYAPGDSLSGLHSAVAVIAVFAALVAAVCMVADATRTTVGILPSVVILLVIGGLYVTGPTLAWDQLTAVGPVDHKGVLVAFDDDVVVIQNGDQSILPKDFRRVGYLHAVGLPLLIVAMGAGGLWAARRSARLANLPIG